MNIPKALVIAGWDPSGGAGLVADINAFSKLGVYASAVITAVTIQNTKRLYSFKSIEPKLVSQQLDAVLQDITPNYAKTGMLATPEIAQAVASSLKKHGLKAVVDPVSSAQAGGRLATQNALEITRKKLLPLAVFTTPNYEEAEELTGIKVTGISSAKLACNCLVSLGAENAVVTGIPFGSNIADAALVKGNFKAFIKKRRNIGTHGGGCVFASALCAFLCQGLSPLSALEETECFVSGIINKTEKIGKGLHTVWPGFTRL